MTASYVFAKADQLSRLLSLLRSPSLQYRVWDPESRRMVVHGHPHFRLMRGLEPSVPWAIVSDAQLEPLRRIERRRKPRGAVKAVAVGSTVRLSEGGFAGLDGIVESVRNKFATVIFSGFPVPVQVGCWLLTEKLDETQAVDVSQYPFEQAKAA